MIPSVEINAQKVPYIRKIYYVEHMFRVVGFRVSEQPVFF